MFGMGTPIRTAAKRSKREARKAPKAGPRGEPYWPVTAKWKAEIRRRLIARGWSQAELARRIEASPAAIVLIFKDETIQTRLVPAIHKVLDLAPPSLTVTVEAA